MNQSPSYSETTNALRNAASRSDLIGKSIRSALGLSKRFVSLAKNSEIINAITQAESDIHQILDIFATAKQELQAMAPEQIVPAPRRRAPMPLEQLQDEMEIVLPNRRQRLNQSPPQQPAEDNEVEIISVFVPPRLRARVEIEAQEDSFDISSISDSEEVKSEDSFDPALEEEKQAPALIDYENYHSPAYDYHSPVYEPEPELPTIESYPELVRIITNMDTLIGFYKQLRDTQNHPGSLGVLQRVDFGKELAPLIQRHHQFALPATRPYMVDYLDDFIPSELHRISFNARPDKDIIEHLSNFDRLIDLISFRLFATNSDLLPRDEFLQELIGITTYIKQQVEYLCLNSSGVLHFWGQFMQELITTYSAAWMLEFQRRSNGTTTVDQLMELVNSKYAAPFQCKTLFDEETMNLVPYQTLASQQHLDTLHSQTGELNCILCLEAIELEDSICDGPCKHYFHYQCSLNHCRSNLAQDPFLHTNATVKGNQCCPYCRTPLYSAQLI